MKSEEITRSRFVREILLNALWGADGAGAGFGFSFEQLRNGFSASRVDVGEPELRRELNDLADEKLIRRTWDEDLDCDMYAIAARGRDFKKSGCPWEKLNEFSS